MSIAWNRAFPSSTSTGGDVVLDWQSMMTNIASGLSASFYWPGSGGGSSASAGEAKLGSLRMARNSFVAKGPYGDGYLQMNSASGAAGYTSVAHIGSTWTGLVSHNAMLDYASGGSFPQTWRWFVQEGSLKLPSSSASTITFTFPTKYSVAPPFVAISTVSVGNGGAPKVFAGVLNASVTTSQFSSVYSTNESSTSFLLLWRSEGTVAL